MKNFKEFFTESHECYLDEARKSYGKRGSIKGDDDPAVQKVKAELEAKEKERAAATKASRAKRNLPPKTKKEKSESKKRNDRTSGRADKRVLDALKAQGKEAERRETRRPVTRKEIDKKAIKFVPGSGIIRAKLKRERDIFKQEPLQRTKEYAQGAADAVRTVASAAKGGTTGSEGGDIQGGRSTRIERG